jgi:putative photosynthetic complex assembly protein 2
VADHGLPVLYALFLWWFSTGLILYLDGLPRRSFRWSMLACTGVALLSFWGLAATRDDTTVLGAYAAFTYGLLIWGWHEMSFLMGFVTGPRRAPCPEGCRGWRHLGHATAAILWHELAIAATALIMVVLTWGGTNQVGTWIFMVLWVMRLSAKFNVYLGVPNLTEEFLPQHLSYLKSFMRKRPMNPLFPISVTVGTIVATRLVDRAWVAGEGSFDAIAFTFVAVLLALAILEHWFLVLPLPDAALWSWALKSRESNPSDERSSGLPSVAALPTFAALSAIGRRT